SLRCRSRSRCRAVSWPSACPSCSTCGEPRDARPPGPMTALALAVALDLLVGEPPNRWHPVAGIGTLIARGRRLAPGRPVGLLLWGAVLILVVAGISAGRALGAHAAPAALPVPVAVLGDAWLLKCSFSLGGLFAAVEVTRGHLVAGDLAGARRQ